MKPVVIIAIAVVCSVVAILGVLVGLQQIETIQVQQSYDKYQQELMNQKLVEVRISEIEDMVVRELCMQSTLDMDSFYDCVENDLDYILEFQITQCDVWPEWDETMSTLCEASIMNNYYEFLIPIIEKLSETERNQLEIDYQFYQEQSEEFLILAKSYQNLLECKANGTCDEMVDEFKNKVTGIND
jgi:Na+-transporting NADH:ubiquinone oxidoreductase subunit NqrC